MATAAPTHHPVRDTLRLVLPHHGPPAPQELLESHTEFHARAVELRDTAQTFETAHAYGQTRYEQLTFGLRVTTLVLSTVVSASIFISLATNPSTAAKITVGVLGLLTTISAALNHSRLFAAQATAHRKALAAYGSVYNEAGQMLVALEGGDIPPEEARQTLSSLWDRAEELEGAPPHVSLHQFKKAHKWAKNEQERHPA